MRAREIIEGLRAHYIAPKQGATDGGAFAHEVSVNGTWGIGSRRADAIYAGFTSASGRILIGHEVKVSRSDWRAELDDPEKSSDWADACHAWYIVAPSTEIVPPEELPHGWGLMIPPKASSHRRFRTVVKAGVKEDHDPPWWAVRSFMARLDTLASQDVHSRISDIYSEARSEVAEEVESLRRRLESQRIDDDSASRLSILDRLESLVGMSISSWLTDLEREVTSCGDLVDAVALLRSLRRISEGSARVNVIKDDLGKSLESLDAAASAASSLLEGTE